MKKNYSVFITAKKALYSGIMAVIGAAIAVFSGAEPTITIILTVAVLTAIHNFIKHNHAC